MVTVSFPATTLTFSHSSFLFLTFVFSPWDFYSLGQKIIIIPRQYLWCCHHGRAIARIHPIRLLDVERRQAAADPRPSQTT